MNLRVIALGSQLGCTPLEVNMQKGEIELIGRKWKEVLCMSYFIVYATHASYVILRLPYLLLQGVHIPLLCLLLHSSLLIGYIGVTCWHFFAFFRHPGITATCFNKAFETWGFPCEGRLPNTNDFPQFSIHRALKHWLV